MGAVVILILLALLWVVLIVPRQREVRRHNALVASLAVGDEVITTAGVYGRITDMTDDTIHLEIAPSVTIKMAKRAVSSVVDPHEDDQPSVETSVEPSVDSSVDSPGFGLED